LPNVSLRIIYAANSRDLNSDTKVNGKKKDQIPPPPSKTEWQIKGRQGERKNLSFVREIIFPSHISIAYIHLLSLTLTTPKLYSSFNGFFNGGQ
jgi:hypothetical protein